MLVFLRVLLGPLLLLLHMLSWVTSSVLRAFVTTYMKHGILWCPKLRWHVVLTSFFGCHLCEWPPNPFTQPEVWVVDPFVCPSYIQSTYHYFKCLSNASHSLCSWRECLSVPVLVLLFIVIWIPLYFQSGLVLRATSMLHLERIS